MTTAFAVEWIKKVKTQFSSYRTAIIFRYGVKEIQDVLHELLKDEDVSWSIVDSSKISVISVEAAKGLEFEAVVAIVSQMTNNEKYVINHYEHGACADADQHNARDVERLAKLHISKLGV